MAYLEVDMSQVQEAAEILSNAVSPEGFEKLMKRTLNEVGKKSKTLITNAAKEEYTFKVGWFKSAIKSAKINGGGYHIDCVIPLSGARGANKTIFPSGGRTSKGRIPKGKRYKVWLRDTKENSTLPYEMDSYGGQPPFKNGMPIMTRVGKARGPLRQVMGIAMPQMPLTRAQDSTRTELLDYAMERLIHNFDYMFAK